MSSKSVVSIVLSSLLRCFDAQENKNDVNHQKHTSTMTEEPDRPFSYASAVTGGVTGPIEDPVYETSAVENEQQSAYTPVSDMPAENNDYDIEAALDDAGDSPLKAASQLWTLDSVNRLKPGVDYQVNTQLKARSYSEDCADEPFIQFISDDVWERPTYRTFKQLLNNYVAETGIPERVEHEETEEENAFLDAILETPVGQFTRRWLDTYCDDVDASDDEAFKDVLRSLWFKLYGRNTGHDSCGFEHAFIGELDDGSVKGLHNFIQVYVEETRGNFDYRGFLEYGRIRGDVADHDRLLTIRFKWLGSLKPASTMFVGVSPEFEVCLYSLLWLTGAQGGTVELGSYDVRVKVYDMHGCVGAAFPELIGHFVAVPRSLSRSFQLMTEVMDPVLQSVGSKLPSAFVGIDAGGSSTRAVLLNAQGVVVRCGTSAAGNPHVSASNTGVSAVLIVLQKVLLGEVPATVVVALSGGDDSEMVNTFEQGIRSACLFSTATKLVVCHDVVAPAGLVIGPKQPFCAVLIAGTGSVAASFHVSASIELLSRAGGRGPLVGDEGSAHAIATGALAHALRIFDGMSDGQNHGNIKDANAVLMEAIAAFNIQVHPSSYECLKEAEVSALVAALHAEGSTRTKVAGLAARLAPLAVRGNAVVNQAFANAGSALSLLVSTVITRGFPSNTSDVPVVVAGGVFDAWDEIPAFRTAFNSALQMLPGYTLTFFRLDSPQYAPNASPAAIGAARLGALLIDADNIPLRQLSRECLRPLRPNEEETG